MRPFISSIAIFFGALLLQWLLWHLFPIKRQVRALLILFGVVLIVTVFYLAKTHGLSSIIQFVLFFGSASLGYTAFHTALQADSPTVIFILRIAKAATEGLPREFLVQEFTDETLVIPRIKDLVNDKMIYEQNGKYFLTEKGKGFLATLSMWEKLIKKRGGAKCL